jgi:hypothetical protein
LFIYRVLKPDKGRKNRNAAEDSTAFWTFKLFETQIITGGEPVEELVQER